MAIQSPTPAASGVNAAHADIPITESFQDRWLEAEQGLKTALDASEAVFDERAIAEARYYAERPAQPRQGAIIHSEGQTFTMDEAFSNAQLRQEEWKKADADCRVETGLANAEVEADAAADATYAAIAALMETPAPNREAIIRKIHLSREYGLEWDEGLIHVVKDLERSAHDGEA